MSERWFYIKNGVLYEHVENDGATFLRKGAEAFDTPLCSVADAKLKYPKELQRALNENPTTVS